MIPARIAFGRLPHDPVRLAAVPPHVMAAEAPAPPELPRPSLEWTPSLVRNDVAPTCTIAGLTNSARVWDLLRGYDLVTREAALLAFYASLAGCQDTEAAIEATEGLVMLDVLEAVATKGFHIGAQDDEPLVPRVNADPAGRSGAALRDAIFSRGTAYIGVTLRQADVQPGAIWAWWPGGCRGCRWRPLHHAVPPRPGGFHDGELGDGDTGRRRLDHVADGGSVQPGLVYAVRILATARGFG